MVFFLDSNAKVFVCSFFFNNRHNRFPLLLIIRKYFFDDNFNNNFHSFDFNILSYLNSNPNHLVEICFIRVFIVDSLMCLNISLIALKISKSSSSGSIITNFLFYCFSSFYLVVNMSVTVMKAYVNSIT